MNWKKKVILLALVLIVGAPYVLDIWSAVDDAMHGDWSIVKFFGAVAWVETAVYLVFAYFRPNEKVEAPNE